MRIYVRVDTRVTPDEGFGLVGTRRVKSSRPKSLLSYHLPYSSKFMADPNQQLPPGWTAEWQVKLSFLYPFF
jgi:hypothetical protein